MKASNTAAWSASRTRQRSLRLGAVLTTVIVAVALTTGSALAAKGGSKASSDPWIALAAVGVDGGAAALTSATPTLGEWVSFDAGYPKNISIPRVYILCYQEGQVVFGQAGHVDDFFRLGSGGSAWMSNGGDADCTATLYYYGSVKGQQTYVELASTEFAANG